MDAEPGLVERERSEMATYAPELEWHKNLTWRHGRRAYGWKGLAPVWAAERAKPTGVDELLAGRRLELKIIYPEAFPSVPPSLTPVDPDVPVERRTLSSWHVNGDGSLCLLRTAEDWQPTDTAAALVRKASGWLLEYLLMDAGEIDRMTEHGIFNDTSLDEILARRAG